MVTATATVYTIEPVNAFTRLDDVFTPHRIVRPTTYRNPFVEYANQPGPIRTGIYVDPDAKVEAKGIVSTAIEAVGAYWQRLINAPVPATVYVDKKALRRK